MNKIRSYIHSTGFKFADHQAHVLSGEEEAMFNWVTANYLNWLDKGEGGSVGVLDLGGASLEAAYETPYDILDGWIEVDLFESVHRLYGRSYLQLGVNESFMRLILKTEMYSMEFNPCVPTGYTLDYSDPNNGFRKKLVGLSNPETCSSLIQSIIEADLPCHYPMDPNGKTECHAYGIYAPPQAKNMTFYAIDGFWDFTKELKLYEELDEKKSHTAITLPVIKMYVDILCTSKWKDLRKRFHKADEDFLAQACFLGMFIYEILTTGLGFSEDFENFIFAHKVNKSPLGWAPGLMVYQVDKMPVTCSVCSFQPPRISTLYYLNASTPFEEEEENVIPEGNLDNERFSDMSLIIIIFVTLFVFGVLLYIKVTKFNKETILGSSRGRYIQLA